MKKKILPFLFAGCSAVASFGQANYCGKVIGGYVADWEDASNVNYNQLTHAFIAFIGSDANGNLCTYEAGGGGTVTSDPIDVSVKTKANFEKYIAAANAAKCKKILSIGGYGCDNFMNAMASGGKVSTFVTNLMAFVDKYKFDGVDLDWEALDNPTHTANYASVCSAIRAATTQKNKLLFCTVVTGYYAAWFPYAEVQKADYVQLMAYDQTATWAAAPPGNHSTIAHANEGITKWAGFGIAKSKMVLGLPFYGYQALKTGGNKTGDWTYKKFVSTYPNAGDVDDYSFSSTETIGLNGQTTIKAKTAIGYNQLAGVMVWEMTNDVPYTDAKSLHVAIIAKMKELCPSGSGNTTDINDITTPIASSYYNSQLNQVQVSIVNQGKVKVSILNLLGQELLSSDLGTVAAGDYSVSLNKTAIKGGVYIVSISFNDERVSSKIYVE